MTTRQVLGHERNPRSSVSEAAYRALSTAIARGVYASGTRLPSERVLASELNISRVSLRKALHRLHDEDWVDPDPQRGWFVREHRMAEPPSVLQSLTEMAAARGLEVSTRVLKQELRSATFDEATQLRLPPSAPVLHLHRLRSLGEVRVCLDRSVIGGDAATVLAEFDLVDRSLYDVLEHDCSVSLFRSSFSVQADGADAAAAELLQIDTGTPVLVGRDLTYDAAQRPVILSHVIYRGDSYRLQADLYRPRIWKEER